mmetsp:Transcript_7503/g.13495  ORF Transcript_7503/g.13495 Transcript_7503/m.13495 type:complete len:407 (+) Transcript_7503:2348-3568(+)
MHFDLPRSHRTLCYLPNHSYLHHPPLQPPTAPLPLPSYALSSSVSSSTGSKCWDHQWRCSQLQPPARRFRRRRAMARQPPSCLHGGVSSSSLPPFCCPVAGFVSLECVGWRNADCARRDVDHPSVRHPFRTRLCCRLYLHHGTCYCSLYHAHHYHDDCNCDYDCPILLCYVVVAVPCHCCCCSSGAAPDVEGTCCCCCCGPYYCLDNAAGSFHRAFHPFRGRTEVEFQDDGGGHDAWDGNWAVACHGCYCCSSYYCHHHCCSSYCRRRCGTGHLLPHHRIKRPPRRGHTSCIQQCFNAKLYLSLFAGGKFVVPLFPGGESIWILGMAGGGRAEGALDVYLRRDAGFGFVVVMMMMMMIHISLLCCCCFYCLSSLLFDCTFDCWIGHSRPIQNCIRKSVSVAPTWNQ